MSPPQRRRVEYKYQVSLNCHYLPLLPAFFSESIVPPCVSSYNIIPDNNFSQGSHGTDCRIVNPSNSSNNFLEPFYDSSLFILNVKERF